MRNLVIENKYNNKNIMHVLSKEFPGLTKNNIFKLFRKKEFKVNSKWIKQDYICKEKDILSIYANDSMIFGIPETIKYYYEDDNILVAYKPKGIVSHSEMDSDVSFESLIKKDKNSYEIEACHRLDTNTEGLTIFSKTKEANIELLNAFKNNLLQKQYIAYVYGKMPQEKEILTAYLIKDSNGSFATVISDPREKSYKIITEYEVLSYSKTTNSSCLLITLHTGKTHQIRAHMKYIGCPVIGDSKYSTNLINKKFKSIFKSQALFAARYKFNFDKKSPLNYLNNICISLDIDKITSLV